MATQSPLPSGTVVKMYVFEKLVVQLKESHLYVQEIICVYAYSMYRRE